MKKPNNLIVELKKFLLENKNVDGDFWHCSGHGYILKIFEKNYSEENLKELELDLINWNENDLDILTIALPKIAHYTYYDQLTDINALENNRLGKYYSAIIPRFRLMSYITDWAIETNDKYELLETIACNLNFLIYHFNFIVNNDGKGIEKITSFIQRIKDVDRTKIDVPKINEEITQLETLVKQVPKP
ncbi:MAG: hypothetical protein GQ574_03465 [Crocinitomix sp.]|nr:hypothetical protein [Crocinitomix sp.]